MSTNIAINIDREVQSSEIEQAAKRSHLIPAKLFHVEKLSDAIPKHILSVYLLFGPAHVMIENGEPIAAAGVIVGKPGIGTAWAMITDRAKAKPKALHSATVRMLSAIIAEKELRRVDYIVDPDDISAVKWAARLGFEYEGTLRSFFSHGHDAYLCAWVKDNGTGN